MENKLQSIVDNFHFNFEEYYTSEKECTKLIAEAGFHTIKWYTAEGDSFGPLVRAVTATKDGKRWVAYYS